MKCIWLWSILYCKVEVLFLFFCFIFVKITSGPENYIWKRNVRKGVRRVRKICKWVILMKICDSVKKEERSRIDVWSVTVNQWFTSLICTVWSIGMVSKWNLEWDWLIILIYIYICSLINWDRRKQWWSIVNWFHKYRWIKVEEIIHWILGVKVIHSGGKKEWKP